ncbi:sigma 54 modulation/S30EA ribosomal C-terminal domain-containing protein [Nocardia vinacea]|uniref:sigma 54 modulation/S30EA ribosomal C-terminal domain-containing protein n=1 Tax=Nocardia vinacea TaxID=96468 RepID=UPI0002F887CC|nr:sigma 54 modulation/S30EA ribosomal C-terminal domain-containing protein [Nocardia vinacea]
MSVSGKWSTPAFPDIVVFPRGPIAELELERVAGAVGRLLTRNGVDGGARVRVVVANCPSGPQLVQVNLCVRGTPARVQTITPGAGMVLPVVLRLERLIERLTTKQRVAPEREPIRRLLAASGHGTITRRKNCSLLVGPPDAAAAVLDAMDYDAHLFVDAETGADAIVYRGDPAGIGLVRAPCDPAAADPKIPELSETAAVDRLCTIGLPFLFFIDPVSRRGHLLYRRYDADLGLITPRTS